MDSPMPKIWHIAASVGDRPAGHPSSGGRTAGRRSPRRATASGRCIERHHAHVGGERHRRRGGDLGHPGMPGVGSSRYWSCRPVRPRPGATSPPSRRRSGRSAAACRGRRPRARWIAATSWSGGKTPPLSLIDGSRTGRSSPAPARRCRPDPVPRPTRPAPRRDGRPTCRRGTPRTAPRRGPCRRAARRPAGRSRCPCRSRKATSKIDDHAGSDRARDRAHRAPSGSTAPVPAAAPSSTARRWCRTATARRAAAPTAAPGRGTRVVAVSLAQTDDARRRSRPRPWCGSPTAGARRRVEQGRVGNATGVTLDVHGPPGTVCQARGPSLPGQVARPAAMISASSATWSGLGSTSGGRTPPRAAPESRAPALTSETA